MNEEKAGSGKSVFKGSDNKLDEAGFVESDIDGELLFIIP